MRQARAVGKGYQLTDISIPYLLLNDKSLRDILNAKRYLKNHVLKTAAAIAMLTASRGKYAEKNEEAGK